MRAGLEMAYDPAVETYRSVRRSGTPDFPAWQAALEVLRQQCPDMSEEAAGLELARMIAEASSRDPVRFWGA